MLLRNKNPLEDGACFRHKAVTTFKAFAYFAALCGQEPGELVWKPLQDRARFSAFLQGSGNYTSQALQQKYEKTPSKEQGPTKGS